MAFPRPSSTSCGPRASVPKQLLVVGAAPSVLTAGCSPVHPQLTTSLTWPRSRGSLHHMPTAMFRTTLTAMVPSCRILPLGLVVRILSCGSAKGPSRALKPLSPWDLRHCAPFSPVLPSPDNNFTVHNSSRLFLGVKLALAYSIPMACLLNRGSEESVPKLACPLIQMHCLQPTHVRDPHLYRIPEQPPWSPAERC